MKNFDKILNHDFIKQLLDDGNLIVKDRKFSLTDIELVNPNFNEFEYYIHNCGFWAIHLINLCEQLQNAIELLSNFRYAKNNKINRADHLTYNIENYIIRLASLPDRICQTINAVFHLGIDEKDVNEKIITNDIHVSRTEIDKHYKDFRKTLQMYIGDRNTIIHRHSYMNKQLRKIQLFYHATLSQRLLGDRNVSEDFKLLRKELLSEHIAHRKKEFTETNEKCFEKILPLLSDCNKYYVKMKARLEE